MKNLSSFYALATLMSLAVPALGQNAAEEAEFKAVTTITPVFSRTERDMAASNPAYFTIDPKSVKLRLIEAKDDAPIINLAESNPKSLEGILVSVEKIVNIGSKIWKIVQENAPVAQIETKYATAYPAGVTSATQLAGWSRPRSYVYGFYAENLFGATMIDCEYKVTYTYGGSYKGNGRFLTAVAVVPTKVDVAWGYKFYMNASVPDSTVVNVGSDVDPIAAMQLKLNWKMATVLKESDGTSVYYIQGNGYYEEIATPWKKGPAVEDVSSAAPLLEGNVF